MKTYLALENAIADSGMFKYQKCGIPRALLVLQFFLKI